MHGEDLEVMVNNLAEIDADQIAMTQFRLQEVKDGKLVDWLEHVSDAEYGV